MGNYRVLYKAGNKLSIILFICLNLFFIYLYKTYVNIPHMTSDALEYFNVSYHIFKNNLPVNLTADIPIGYSLFLYLNKIFYNDLNNIILLQYFIFIISGSYLIYQTYKINLILGLSSLISLIFISINDLTIQYHTSLLPDSLFCSGIIGLIGLLFRFLSKKNLLNYFLLLLNVFILILLRSNGLIFIFIPLIIFFYNFNTNSNKIKIIIILLLFFSSINFFIKGDFFFTDYKRFSEKFIENKLPYSELLIPSESYNEMLFKYSTHYFKDTKRYFFTHVYSNEYFFFDFKDTEFNKHNLAKFKPFIFFLSNDLQSYIFRCNKQNKIQTCLFDFNCKNHFKWFALIDYFMKYLHLLKVILFLTGFVLLLKNIFLNQKLFYHNLMISFLLFYILMIIILPLFNIRYQDRYIWPFEILYLFMSSFFIISELFRKYLNKNEIQNFNN